MISSASWNIIVIIGSVVLAGILAGVSIWSVNLQARKTKLEKERQLVDDQVANGELDNGEQVAKKSLPSYLEFGKEIDAITKKTRGISIFTIVWTVVITFSVNLMQCGKGVAEKHEREIAQLQKDSTEKQEAAEVIRLDDQQAVRATARIIQLSDSLPIVPIIDSFPSHKRYEKSFLEIADSLHLGWTSNNTIKSNPIVKDFWEKLEIQIRNTADLMDKNRPNDVALKAMIYGKWILSFFKYNFQWILGSKSFRFENNKYFFPSKIQYPDYVHLQDSILKFRPEGY